MATHLTDPPTATQLVGIGELARWLNRSVASLRRDDASGRLPAPVRIGGSKKWRRDEIAAWVSAGCPIRDAWTFHTPRGDR